MKYLIFIVFVSLSSVQARPVDSQTKFEDKIELYSDLLEDEGEIPPEAMPAACFGHWQAYSPALWAACTAVGLVCHNSTDPFDDPEKQAKDLIRCMKQNGCEWYYRCLTGTPQAGPFQPVEIFDR